MKPIRTAILFATFIFAFTACKDKSLSQKYLTHISVVREVEEANNPKKETATPLQTEPKEVEKTYSLPERTSQKTEYHIIVASFSYAERNRAEKLLKELKARNFPAQIIDSKKRYRVSIESVSNMDQANKIRDDYRKVADRQDIWILKSE